MEFKASDGNTILGVGTRAEHEQPGQKNNAIVVLVVENLTQSLQELAAKDISLVSEPVEVAGQFKTAFITDPDGNYFQLFEKLG